MGEGNEWFGWIILRCSMDLLVLTSLQSRIRDTDALLDPFLMLWFFNKRRFKKSSGMCSGQKILQIL